jgi:hypothetical protein
MRILIADDSSILRCGIAALLTGVDVSLPDINGLEISRRLRLNLPHIKMLWEAIS